MVYKFYDKKISGSGIKNGDISNKELAEDLTQTNYSKIKKKGKHSHIL